MGTVVVLLLGSFIWSLPAIPVARELAPDKRRRNLTLVVAAAGLVALFLFGAILGGAAAYTADPDADRGQFGHPIALPLFLLSYPAIVFDCALVGAITLLDRHPLGSAIGSVAGAVVGLPVWLGFVLMISAVFRFFEQ